MNETGEPLLRSFRPTWQSDNLYISLPLEGSISSVDQDEVNTMVTAEPTTPSETSSEPELYRLPMTPEVYKDLEAEATKKGKTVTEYISDALSLQKWFDDVLSDGGSLIARPKHRHAEIIKARR